MVWLKSKNTIYSQVPAVGGQPVSGHPGVFGHESKQSGTRSPSVSRVEPQGSQLPKISPCKRCEINDAPFTEIAFPL